MGLCVCNAGCDDLGSACSCCPLGIGIHFIVMFVREFILCSLQERIIIFQLANVFRASQVDVE